MNTIIWPSYIDANITRKFGRKLSKAESVEEPKVREISQALRKHKIEHIVEHDKAFPATWWEKSGRIVIKDNQTPKMELLRLISKSIKQSR